MPVRKIFLSYAWSDDPNFAERIYHDLKETDKDNGEFDVWRDVEDMPNRGLAFTEEVKRQIDERHALVLVVGPQAMQSEYVRQEWEYALSHCKPIIPLLRKSLRADGQPDFSDLPGPLREVLGVEFHQDNRYFDSLRQLRGLLRGEKDLAVGPFFGTLHQLAPYYIPRNFDIERIDHAVRKGPCQKLIVIQGLPGSGKSVLATAYAGRCQTRRFFPNGIFWLDIGSEPDQDDRLLGHMMTIGRVFEDQSEFFGFNITLSLLSKAPGQAMPHRAR